MAYHWIPIQAPSAGVRITQKKPFAASPVKAGGSIFTVAGSSEVRVLEPNAVAPTAGRMGKGGERLYISGHPAGGVVEQWNLSTPYDLSTATYITAIGGSGTYMSEMSIAANGEYIYMWNVVTRVLYRRSLTVPWELSATAAVDNITAPESNGYSMCVASDGSKMIVTFLAKTMYVYTMSTPWDIAGATRVSVSQNVFGLSAFALGGLCFSPDGTHIYVLATNDIYSYVLDTPFDITGVVTPLDTYDMSGLSGQLEDIDVWPEENHWYATRYVGLDSVIELKLR